MYAGLTGITFILLFGLIFWSTGRFMRHQIDDSVSSEIGEIATDEQAKHPEGLRLLVQGMARHPSGFYYLLQDSQGTALAGNLPPTEPRLGVREWAQARSDGRTLYSGIRGQGVRISGDYLFVGWSTHQLHEMEEFIVGAFLWILCASILLALSGGLFMSRRLMWKIENVSRTTRNIMDGDLQQRVPVQHGGDEFEHLALSINSMLDRIETLMEDLRQVTTNIAHDLRTPLTRLRNRLELAQRSPLAEAGLRDAINAACRETDVILEIFGALMRIAQVESGARRSGFAAVELREVIDTVVEVYKPAVEEKRQSLVEITAKNLVVFGDKELLTQLFANVLENAILHSPPGARLSIEARRDTQRVQVTIADNGPGIAESMRGKVLGRFVRLDDSRTTPGSGLGLSLVAAIARLHNAALTLEGNEPGLKVCLTFEAAAG
jgi:signal transduction histidine kinase